MRLLDHNVQPDIHQELLQLELFGVRVARAVYRLVYDC